MGEQDPREDHLGEDDHYRAWVEKHGSSVLLYCRVLVTCCCVSWLVGLHDVWEVAGLLPVLLVALQLLERTRIVVVSSDARLQWMTLTIPVAVLALFIFRLGCFVFAMQGHSQFHVMRGLAPTQRPYTKLHLNAEACRLACQQQSDCLVYGWAALPLPPCRLWKQTPEQTNSSLVPVADAVVGVKHVVPAARMASDGSLFYLTNPVQLQQSDVRSQHLCRGYYAPARETRDYSLLREIFYQSGLRKFVFRSSPKESFNWTHDGQHKSNEDHSLVFKVLTESGLRPLGDQEVASVLCQATPLNMSLHSENSLSYYKLLTSIARTLKAASSRGVHYVYKKFHYLIDRVYKASSPGLEYFPLFFLVF